MGMVLGIAQVTPGVSAGTMAVILKIYDRLLDAISLDLNKLKRNLSFLIPLGVGVVGGVLLFSNLITYLFDNFNMQTNFAFIGVILGSIPMIYKKITAEGKVKPNSTIVFIVPLLFMLYMALSGEGGENTNIIRELNVYNTMILVFAGAISAFTMIIPGISGSFILLTIGCYTTVVTAVSELNVVVLIPVAVGVVIGLLGGSQLVRALLKSYTQATYLAILGLVVGSIFTLYPGISFDMIGVVSVICMVVAFVISYYFSEK
ncbi:MAG: hypothetical protein ATN35_01035 [Epulopiscium sp. Nele67-Bin004]|nr:MAG: hypothetical protein ATN35_01035 [Epulopiscium sp. Nele67-Bin004]